MNNKITKLNRRCLLNCIDLTISDKIKVFEFEHFNHEAKHSNKRIEEKEGLFATDRI